MLFLKRWFYFTCSAVLILAMLLVFPFLIPDSTIMGGVICFVLAAYILLTAQLIGKFSIVEWISGFKPNFPVDDAAYAKDFASRISKLALVLMAISGVSLLLIPYIGEYMRLFVIAYIAVMMVGVNTIKVRLYRKYLPEEMRREEEEDDPEEQSFDGEESEK